MANSPAQIPSLSRGIECTRSPSVAVGVQINSTYRLPASKSIGATAKNWCGA